jgi:hypothetical protein
MEEKNDGQQLLRTIAKRKQRAKKGLENYLFHVNTDKQSIKLPDVDQETGQIIWADDLNFPVGSQLFFSHWVSLKPGKIGLLCHRWYRFRLCAFQHEVIKAREEPCPVRFNAKKVIAGADIENIFDAPEIQLEQTTETTAEEIYYRRQPANIVDFWAYYGAGNRPKEISRKDFKIAFSSLLSAVFDNPAEGEGREKQQIKIIL